MRTFLLSVVFPFNNSSRVKPGIDAGAEGEQFLLSEQAPLKTYINDLGRELWLKLRPRVETYFGDHFKEDIFAIHCTYGEATGLFTICRHILKTSTKLSTSERLVAITK